MFIQKEIEPTDREAPDKFLQNLQMFFNVPNGEDNRVGR